MADTLRGTLSPIRSCFDVTYYNLQLKVDVEEKSISGVNHIHFKNVEDFDSIQIDLFANMTIDSVLFKGKKLQFNRLFDAVFLVFPDKMVKGKNGRISVYYHGVPTQAKNAPWDGGFVWKKDSNGKPWVGVACEGTGASLWWPNKDHLSDEPDSMRVLIKTPLNVSCVSNGNLRSKRLTSEGAEHEWFISYPINNYNVSINIGNYRHFADEYASKIRLGDTLELDYYVLKENFDKAKKQFQIVPEMLDCFEEAFGPYPFYDDGYALVETPYLGMEHQSAIAYGNKYMSGYLGRHPEGMEFDYIIIHETGHEWWGNNVSMKDAADMWIHESFCTYSEAVYVECRYGYDKMLDYLNYQKSFINNRSPIYGVYGLNHEGNGGDMYYKGAWMIHTFRNVINNDSLFRSILKGIQEEFAYQTVDGEQMINYINQKAEYNYTPFFNQYLKFSEVPILEFRWEKKSIQMRWKAGATGFRMPVVYETSKGGQSRILVNNQDWVSISLKKRELKSLRFREDLMLYLTEKIK